ncbi:DUF554 domain-containing protein [Alicyclobacillus macrosporangiidus]|uniref:Membrane protein YdfK n=1 Tax=Alicyclobacillus macrosporangiidus TaxID=392015 RepID=A0A1I7HNY3_9BACL|nr:DUF554 domain-containing protein [Alicyclobacillus macrosporangiidus]SFU62418.1 hypothetical protein SAMN05421543_10519 [Alicyclobacillus macrosporangiidus]
MLLGAIVNAVAIVIGTTLGRCIPGIRDGTKTAILQGLSLAVVLIGLSMALADTADLLIVVVSMAIGGALGEWLGIESWLDRVGQRIESRFKTGSTGRVAQAFVTASLVFCVGSMSIVGAIQSGVQGQNNTLYVKSMLDGFTAILFASTFGPGVYLSAPVVLIYEGAIALAAHVIGAALANQAVIACLTATGGLLIVGIGLTLLGVKKIAVGNLLPAMLVAAVLKGLAPHINHALHAWWQLG